MCASEVSDIENSIWRAYRDAGVQVFGVASDDPPDVARAYAEALGLSFPILLDEGGAVHREYAMFSAFSTAAYPQDWIIGTDGRVVYANNAFEPDVIRAVLDRELAE